MSRNELSTLPILEQSYDLTEQQKADYRQKGHIMLRSVASAEEVDIYRPIIGDLVKRLNYHDKPLEERDTYGKAFIQIPNVWRESEAAAKFVLAKRFAKIAAELMGVDSVRIYHDQALYKEPGGGHTPWHQDQIYWPLDSDKTVTLWMPLVPISEEVGSMTFASESHKQGYISKTVISDESHRTLKAFIENKGLEQAQYGAMSAGDATFHAGWTLHSAPGNPTDTMREVITIIYYADGTKVSVLDSNARKSDLISWLPGCVTGEAAASHLNPIVYPVQGE
ncbi:phytanoyl-CoA dioxygenase family protein [Paenibacillus sp. YIM B09110]|uniref:phytanoyl-CoA dioxygenase family protein n=1 Tax=Paenibacillus sp. YIM B09110 TaxID=3126102 RepID=UPI00301D1A40